MYNGSYKAGVSLWSCYGYNVSDCNYDHKILGTFISMHIATNNQLSMHCSIIIHDECYRQKVIIQLINK